MLFNLLVVKYLNNSTNTHTNNRAEQNEQTDFGINSLKLRQQPDYYIFVQYLFCGDCAQFILEQV